MTDITKLAAAQRAAFRSGMTREPSFRKEALGRLRRAILENEEPIAQALYSDLGKSAFEAYETETGMILGEIGYALRHLETWAKPRRVRTPLMHFPSSSFRVPEPYGVTLILSPWNYPLQLTLAPLIGAVAGGNCAVVKPSAYSPATSHLLAGLIGEAFSPEHVAVVEGGRAENSALLEERFDSIFFTGSVAVGRLVMESAARTLTPVTLELGGKSPCIVCADADLDLAARRIVWGKTLNAGQTCVAPDYVLADSKIIGGLTERMQAAVTHFFGQNPCQNPEYPRIVNQKHFERLTGYLQATPPAFGGECDAKTLKIAPAILTGDLWEAPVMQEEIFGPVLPVIPFDSLEEAVERITARPKPLALYLFTQSREVQRRILREVPFGGGCVNDTIVHLATTQMPFGGVGDSGMGAYHGRWSFDTFTHWKSVLKKSTHLDVPLRYPPYGGRLGLLKKMMR